MASNDTPMMVQYHEIKANYPDAFLFYRLGDFYELFEDDAVHGAQLLELTLTARNKNSAEPIPMAGIPYHAAQNYIDILIDQGHKVAIVEQLEAATPGKGMVKRDVVQVITPGTKLADNTTREKQANYLAAVMPAGDAYQLAYADLSTGELHATCLADAQRLVDELLGLEVKEVVLANDRQQTLAPAVLDQLGQHGIMMSYQAATALTSDQNDLLAPVVDPDQQVAVSYLLTYIWSTQKRSLQHLMPVKITHQQAYVTFDHATRCNLDLISNARSNKKAGSLFGVIDATKTAMGGRLLKQWLLKPLRERAAILARQDAVAQLVADFFGRGSLQDSLTSVYDLERLAGRAAMGTMNPREARQLAKSLAVMPALREQLAKFAPDTLLTDIATQLPDLQPLATAIAQALVDEPPISSREGGLLRDSYDTKIQTYRAALQNNHQWLAEFEAEERRQTGINSLKVRYNKNFGYFIEVTKSQISKLDPERYERRQTLTNAERFSTPALKAHAQLILEAETQSTNYEYEVFVALRQQISAAVPALQTLAQQVATVDVLSGLADTAEKHRFVQPTLSAAAQAPLSITNGRHPVIENLLDVGSFVGNDHQFAAQVPLQIITGPNMAGKSTYMRQLALIVILAQIGSFVPADAAELPVFDAIFTRIGANDDLVSGQSTFMVEMAEANHALQHATADSLILFDELGRGTATYDGMALAQAIIEYIDQHVHAKTLFSTHYHELTQLGKNHASMTNIHVGAEEDADGRLHFQHQVLSGPADRSYGVNVAALAGLPAPVITRAAALLADLEQAAPRQVLEAATQMALPLAPEPVPSPVLAALAELDISRLTPLAALNQLADLQAAAQHEKESHA